MTAEDGPKLETDEKQGIETTCKDHGIVTSSTFSEDVVLEETEANALFAYIIPCIDT
jgi:hypothetical protein